MEGCVVGAVPIAVQEVLNRFVFPKMLAKKPLLNGSGAIPNKDFVFGPGNKIGDRKNSYPQHSSE
jgi:hypothetical protein